MPSELFETLLTTTDRDLLHTELELLKTALFKLKENGYEETLKQKVRANVAEIIEREVRVASQKPEEYLEAVASQLEKIPVLQLTIAFEPTQENIEHIANEVTDVAGQPALLELIIRPEIVAGTIIIWNGHYHDASLKPKFEEALEKATRSLVNK